MCRGIVGVNNRRPVVNLGQSATFNGAENFSYFYNFDNAIINNLNNNKEINLSAAPTVDNFLQEKNAITNIVIEPFSVAGSSPTELTDDEFDLMRDSLEVLDDIKLADENLSGLGLEDGFSFTQQGAVAENASIKSEPSSNYFDIPAITVEAAPVDLLDNLVPADDFLDELLAEPAYTLPTENPAQPTQWKDYLEMIATDEESNGSDTCSSASSKSKGKQCNYPGCKYTAQSKGRCKGHGGGSRCKHPGCVKSSQSGGFCRLHGGGKKCKHEGCSKSAQRYGLCSTHGGIRKCSFEGCTKNERGGGYCAEHQLKRSLVEANTPVAQETACHAAKLRGNKCSVAGCSSTAQSKGRCKRHGGGSRCKFPDCTKSSQTGGFCRSHGGGKKCNQEGCMKGAQRDGYCSVHGGIRKCSHEGCTKNDRGGGFCAEHGGGKRCKFDGCIKPCRKHGFCTFHGRHLEDIYVDLM